MIARINPKLKKEFCLEKGELHAFLNPYTYMQLRDHEDLLLHFDKVHFDGIVLCRLYKMLGMKGIPRRSFDMTSLARDVFEQASRSGKTVAIVGSEAGVINQAVNRLESEFGIDVVASRHGFFEDDQDILDYQKQLVGINPDILVVGMGAVRQERFLAGLKGLGWSGTGFTCGGFLHQTANALQYYPEIFNKLNLRWVYRILKEPHTLKRYLFDYPKFLFCFNQDYRRFRRIKQFRAEPEVTKIH